ncbi:MAG TPA: circularly permuted type 2 ATP-grasp protein [Bryobacteraceae bacterium]|jgi:uncharacterized circularly permuted ATP-grasp superfamily protein/uncharacterized alpha-E superfamily protein|nr:circularly permuted type 2 ATP-grasp protein [Bryobacteraceae bacterium]
MSTQLDISDTTLVPSLMGSYSPAPGIYDEMLSAPGVFRPHWGAYIDSISAFGVGELTRRWNTARERIRENGVTYNVYGDPLGMDRPWSLDAIPLLISPNEWRELEAGLIQRARLLNWILTDLYGPQKLLLGGHLAPAAVFANPGFLRPCHNLPVPENSWLHLLAVDLARDADGQWWVISDRTQAPSGAGYALENRIVQAETFPDLFREFRVQRFASFFRSFRNNMLRLSPSLRGNPRVVLLTPGPLNETYFEHSYLARYLGFTLAQGGDLTVRDSRVFLKTLEGLKQVDVILRRVDDSFCDPIELRSDSFLGVAGLVEAVRAGNVAVANALGSGLIESPALMPFLPGLSRLLLGEKLKLPSVATWWCGQPDALDYVKSHLDSLVIKPSFPAMGREPVFGGQLAIEERGRLLDRMRTRPWNFSGQEVLHLSTAPVWSDNSLTARRVVLRVFVAAVGDSWAVMPGGLARVSPTLDTPVVSMQRGGGSKDTWVLSDTPVDRYTLRRSRDLPVAIIRGGTSDLPSRAADNLFWLGRYAERCEHLARVLRCILSRLTGETAAMGSAEWNSLMKLNAILASDHSRLTGDDPQERLDLSRDFEQEILSLIFDEQRVDSLYSNLSRTSRAAASVRDRLSSDVLRVVSQLGALARVDAGAGLNGATAESTPWGYLSPANALAVLNRCIATLSALRGMELENITRSPGWHFLGVGRRIERSLQLVSLFRAIIVPLTPDTQPMLEMLLEVCDSAMTYRSRYLTTLQAAPVLDLLMNDEANPRSLRFQLGDLSEHCAFLEKTIDGAEWPAARQRRVEEAAVSLFDADVQVLCLPDADGTRMYLDHLLANMDALLPALSDAITNTCFSHAEMERVT